MKLTLPIMAFIVLLANSCSKSIQEAIHSQEYLDSIETARFWEYSITGRPVLKQAVYDLKARPGAPKLQKYITDRGRPVWDNSFEFRDANDANTLMVPILNDKQKSTTAILVVSYKNKLYHFRVVLRGRYPKGENVMPPHAWDAFFAAMDKEYYNIGDSKGFILR